MYLQQGAASKIFYVSGAFLLKNDAKSLLRISLLKKDNLPGAKADCV